MSDETDKSKYKTDKNNDEIEERETHPSRWGWELGTAFVLAGAVLSYAVQVHNWRLAQLASVSGVVLLAIGLAFLSRTM